MADIERLESDIRRISEDVKQLSKNVKNEATSAAKIAILEEIQKSKETVDDRIDRRVQRAYLFTVLLLLALGGVGYLGLKTTIPQIVQKSLGSSAKFELEEIKREAREALDEIKQAQSATKCKSLIVLQTDYGTKAPYMGTLMGVIYSINPHARIQTITAEIENFDLIHVAWTLWRASRFYPAGTIFVVITNPGGLTSNPVVLLTDNGHIYIGHDNGGFDLVVEHYGHKASYTIASPELTPTKFGDLFGGVELYGPTAGKLSLGFPFDKIGPVVKRYKPKLSKRLHKVEDTKVIGTVMDIDKFGNVITNITETDLNNIGSKIGVTVQLSFKKEILKVPLKATYGHVSKGDPVAIIYEGFLQLAINEGSFSKTYNIYRGTKVDIQSLTF